MSPYLKSEVPLSIESFLAPLPINIKTLDHGNQLTIHINDKTGQRILNVSGLGTQGLLIKRLQTLDGMQSLISEISENLKSRGYL